MYYYRIIRFHAPDAYRTESDIYDGVIVSSHEHLEHVRGNPNRLTGYITTVLSNGSAPRSFCSSLVINMEAVCITREEVTLAQKTTISYDID